MSNFLIYGANGYTGGLIARESARRGMTPILAGRNAEGVAALAAELKLEQRVFALDVASAVEAGIRGAGAVLHCAGPFRQTSRPMADACIRTGVHYLDITGEEPVFEALAARSAEARAVGVALLPGVGFDVVPTDCLAAHLKTRLPSATHLALGFQGAAQVSRGTALTILESLPDGGIVRENGKLRRVPAAWKTRLIDFGAGPAKAITIPWGDVATAFYTTGIPNIEFYMAAPWGTRVAARASRWFGWLLRSAMVQNWLKRRIHARAPGPTEEQRRNNRCYLWGEATDGTGSKAVARLQTPDAYDVTVQTALAVVEQVLRGDVAPGFQTPAMAFGPDFILQIAGVTRVDEPA
ncbi:MAG: saccharopine dehydrogenase NADP-binding domain-containing protein [Planctomycetes bacterium]|nr:saccharopine dehydrogenase NADP-binding domain-containing protein [Planctomycetota bacterium]